MIETARQLNIAVLFDGAGLARLGLEQAGHKCTGFEIDPVKVHLGRMVGSGNVIQADALTVDLSDFDAVWASPPCQSRSGQNHGQQMPEYDHYNDLLSWALELPHDVLWVENVVINTLPRHDPRNRWGTHYNAVQFECQPRQLRSRIIGGRYRMPYTYRDYKYQYHEFDVCPAVMASERQGNRYKNWNKERRKATKWYGRRLSVSEMAYHQGFTIPNGILESWWYPLDGYTQNQWHDNVLAVAIGNGVPVYMTRAFGEAYTRPEKAGRQMALLPSVA